MVVNLPAAAPWPNHFHRRPGEGRGPEAPALLRASAPGGRLSPAWRGCWMTGTGAAPGRHHFHRRPGEGRGPEAPALLRASAPGAGFRRHDVGDGCLSGGRVSPKARRHPFWFGPSRTRS